MSGDDGKSELERILGKVKSGGAPPAPGKDAADDILGRMAAGAKPAAPAKPVSAADAVLSALRGVAPAASKAPGADDPLEALKAGAAARPAAKSGGTDDILRSLAASAPKPAAAGGDPIDALRRAGAAAGAPSGPAIDDVLKAVAAAAPKTAAPAAPSGPGDRMKGGEIPPPTEDDGTDATGADGGAGAAAEEEGEVVAEARPRRAPAGPYEPDFGTLTAANVPQCIPGRTKFRIAVLGDFSGRANRGALETGEALAARKAWKLDVDTLDRVIGRFRTTLTLPVGAGGGAVAVELGAIDDLHPDALYGALDLFSELGNLRRQVKAGAARPLADLRAWGAGAKPAGPARRGRRAAAIPADRRLDDFASLIGARPVPKATATDELIRRVVAPHVVAAPSPDQPAMLAAVDAALSSAMRSVLHHPDIQTVEAGWRSLDLMARRIETDAMLEIVVYDVAGEELAADLSAQAELERSGLFAMLAERPAEDETQGPIGLIVGLYSFEEAPPHAELLGRMAKIAAHAGAPFVTAMGTGFIGVKPEDRHPLVAKAWDALRALPEARYLGLASPRFLLRLPYGKRSDPIDSFAFEEFTLTEGLRGMLLANPAVLVAVLVAATVKRGGRAADLGTVMTMDDVPFHYMLDSHGDQIALPCTERLLSARMAQEVVARGYMPVLSIKGQNVVRLGSFQSLAGETLAGPWDQGAAKARPGRGGAAVALSAGLVVPGPPPGGEDGHPGDPGDGPAGGGGDPDDVLAGLGGNDDDKPAAAGGGDGDLDALLASLGGDDGTPAAAGGGDDLDALLASLGGEDDKPAEEVGGIDVDLDALLKDL